MKIRIMMKDPDVMYDAIKEAVNNQDVSELSKSEIDEGLTARKERIENLCARWFEYSEYLTVEVDTEQETCVVIPAK